MRPLSRLIALWIVLAPVTVRAASNDLALWKFHGWDLRQSNGTVTPLDRRNVEYGLDGDTPTIVVTDGRTRTPFRWRGGAYRSDGGQLELRVDQAGFRNWVGEFASVLSPAVMRPSDTPGAAGFDVGVEYSISVIGGAGYWADALKGYNRWDNPSGAATPTGAVPGLPDSVQGPLQTVQFRMRKGLPYSLEIGANALYFFGSRMMTAGVDLKAAIIEGYDYAPDVSIRFAYNRLFGSTELNLNLFNVDLGISYPIGLQVVEITPYGGYSGLIADASAAAQDPTFHQAADGPIFRLGREVVYVNRVYAGFRFVVARFVFASEAMINFNNVYTFTFKVGGEF